MQVVNKKYNFCGNVKSYKQLLHKISTPNVEIILLVLPNNIEGVFKLYTFTHNLLLILLFNYINYKQQSKQVASN